LKLETKPETKPEIKPEIKPETKPEGDIKVEVLQLKALRKGDMVSDAQIKALQTILSESGFRPMYDFLKMYLYKIGYTNNPTTLKKATTKGIASKIMDEFNMHIRNIFSIKQFHSPMKPFFEKASKKDKIKLLVGMGGFIYDLEQVPNILNGESTDSELIGYFSLFLKTLISQGNRSVDNEGDGSVGNVTRMIDINKALLKTEEAEEAWETK
jgi:hypothetical protein